MQTVMSMGSWATSGPGVQLRDAQVIQKSGSHQTENLSINLSEQWYLEQ